MPVVLCLFMMWGNNATAWLWCQVSQSFSAGGGFGNERRCYCSSYRRSAQAINNVIFFLLFAGSTTPGSAGSKDSDRIRLESITSDRSENSGELNQGWHLLAMSLPCCPNSFVHMRQAVSVCHSGPKITFVLQWLIWVKPCPCLRVRTRAKKRRISRLHLPNSCMVSVYVGEPWRNDPVHSGVVLSLYSWKFLMCHGARSKTPHQQK